MCALSCAYHKGMSEIITEYRLGSVQRSIFLISVGPFYFASLNLKFIRIYSPVLAFQCCEQRVFCSSVCFFNIKYVCVCIFLGFHEYMHFASNEQNEILHLLNHIYVYAWCMGAGLRWHVLLHIQCSMFMFHTILNEKICLLYQCSHSLRNGFSSTNNKIEQVSSQRDKYYYKISCMLFVLHPYHTNNSCVPFFFFLPSITS